MGNEANLASENKIISIAPVSSEVPEQRFRPHLLLLTSEQGYKLLLGNQVSIQKQYSFSKFLLKIL